MPDNQNTPTNISATPIGNSRPMDDIRPAIASPVPEVPQALDEAPVSLVEVSQSSLRASNIESNAPMVDDITEDPVTDDAVDEITKSDGDEVLKHQDEQADIASTKKRSRMDRFKTGWRDWWSDPRKRWGTIAGIVIGVAALFAVPYTRCNILGVFLSSNITVQAVDSKTGKPVSGAHVTIGGENTETDANGKAKLTVHAGSKELKVTKKYYTGYSHAELISLSATKNNLKATLGAQGRQVSILVVNKITGVIVVDAKLDMSGTSVKTNAKGMATVVVSSGSDNETAKITASGYNTSTVAITPGADVSKNTFVVTPTGKVYFLSNLSGDIDVVKTNLDGTERQTVLAGTGNEDRSTTTLLASQDWQYIALITRRSGIISSLYIIDTTHGDKLVTVDNSSADFNLIGWSGHNFVYQLTRNSTNAWQNNRQAIKSYNPETGQSLSLDQTQGSGTDQQDYVDQYFGAAYILGNQVVYVKNWQASTNNQAQLNTKSAEFDSIGADGTAHRTIKTFGVDSAATSSNVFVSTQPYGPNGVYLYFQTGATASFYSYDGNKITTNTTLTSDGFYTTPYPAYLLSPSGNYTFWSDQRDGKNSLFVGDQYGKVQKQVASLSAFTTYGWYSDDYMLVSKNGSELYVLSRTGVGAPYKISDYYTPLNGRSTGYGGGYGDR